MCHSTQECLSFLITYSLFYSLLTRLELTQEKHPKWTPLLGRTYWFKLQGFQDHSWSMKGGEGWSTVAKRVWLDCQMTWEWIFLIDPNTRARVNIGSESGKKMDITAKKGFIEFITELGSYVIQLITNQIWDQFSKYFLRM